MCGEVEDTDSDNPNNRICHTCISKRSLSNPAKRKQGQDFFTTRHVKEAQTRCVRCEEAPKAARPWGKTTDCRAFGTEGAVHGGSAPVRLWHNRGRIGEAAEGDSEGGCSTHSRSSSSKSARGGDFLQVESAGGESVTAPPPYSDLSEFFGPLEDVAQSAGNS